MAHTVQNMIVWTEVSSDRGLGGTRNGWHLCYCAPAMLLPKHLLPPAQHGSRCTINVWLLALFHPTCYELSSMTGQPCFVSLTALSSAPRTMLGTRWVISKYLSNIGKVHNHTILYVYKGLTEMQKVNTCYRIICELQTSLERTGRSRLSWI